MLDFELCLADTQPAVSISEENQYLKISCMIIFLINVELFLKWNMSCKTIIQNDLINHGD